LTGLSAPLVTPHACTSAAAEAVNPRRACTFVGLIAIIGFASEKVSMASFFPGDSP